MSGGPFVCFSKSYLIKLNELVRKPRTLKRPRVKKSRKLLVTTDISVSHPMSKDDQLVNTKLSQRKKIPDQQIKCLSDTESDRISLLLSQSHHELFAPHLPKHVIRKKIRRLARAHAWRLGIDCDKISDLWLTSYIKKCKPLLVDTEHLSDNNEICDTTITTVSSPNPEERVGFKDNRSKADPANNHVPALATLFKLPSAPQRSVSSRKRKGSASEVLKPVGKVAKTLKYPTACEYRYRQPSTSQHPTFYPVKKKHAYVHSNFLFQRQLFHPKKTECFLSIATEAVSTPICQQLDDVHEELFYLCSDMTDELLFPQSTKANVPPKAKTLQESDDCDSGYRSRGDSQDSDERERDADVPTSNSQHIAETCKNLSYLKQSVPNQVISSPNNECMDSCASPMLHDQFFNGFHDVSDILDLSSVSDFDDVQISPDELDFMNSVLNLDPNPS